jgi:hypothetical protein
MSWVAVAALLASALAAPGCAFLVSDDPIRCEAVAGEADPCPRDRVCVSGFCVPAPVCVPATELCNGLDDDCDTFLDEGHDDDGDGFSWCGAGLADEADCDDTRTDVHPGSVRRSIAEADELCDSRDNDCDESVDEDRGSLCAALEQCFAGVGCAVPDCTYPGFECDAGDACDVDAAPPTCVTGVCTPQSCMAPEVCDAATGSCVRPLPLDSACVVSAQCEEGACVPSRALTGGAGSVCAKACCEDAQCPAGRICWASPSGARACVLPSAIGSARGTSPLGATCSTSAECASARCLDGLCRETCGRNADCDGGDSCALLPSEDVDPAQALSCVDITGGEIGAACTPSAPCASKMCVLRIESGESICLGGCHTSADCPSDMYCGSVSVRGPDAAQTNVQACEPRVHPGGALSGVACSMAWSCRDLACIGGLCADTCCSDTQCPVGFACEPVNRGRDDYEMRCIPR